MILGLFPVAAGGREPQQENERHTEQPAGQQAWRGNRPHHEKKGPGQDIGRGAAGNPGIEHQPDQFVRHRPAVLFFLMAAIDKKFEHT